MVMKDPCSAVNAIMRTRRRWSYRRPRQLWVLVTMACSAILLVVVALMNQEEQRHPTVRTSAAFVGTGALWHRQYATCTAAVQNKLSLRALDPRLKKRIASVETVKRMTDAMHLLAMVKIHQAQHDARAARPFNAELQSMILNVAKEIKDPLVLQSLPMARSSEPVRQVAIVVVASDRGLCGGYLSGIASRCRERVLALNREAGIAPIIIAVGRRSRLIKQRLDRAGANFTWKDSFPIGREPNADLSQSLSEQVTALFLSEEVDKVEFIYNKFVSLAQNQPSVRTLLPLKKSSVQDPDDELFKLTTNQGRLTVRREPAGRSKEKGRVLRADTIFDQPPEEMLNTMLPVYLNSQILGMLREGFAAEVSSRLVAMHATKKNAEEKLIALRLELQKKRQKRVTEECLMVASYEGLREVEGAHEKAMREKELEQERDVMVDEFLHDLEASELSTDDVLPEFNVDPHFHPEAVDIEPNHTLLHADIAASDLLSKAISGYNTSS